MSFTYSRLAGAVAALWLCCAGAAWAGDGGADLGSLQALLSDPTTGLCKIFNMSTCPQMPTVTQGVLEVAGLGNNLPEMVRAQNNILPGTSVTAGNPAAVPPSEGSLTPLPLNSKTSPTVSAFLSTLAPLAFVSQSSGTAKATQLYDPNADTFLYAVGVSSFGFTVPGANLTDPDTVYFFYEDLSRKNENLSSGQIVAKFSFPLTVLNSNGTERQVPTTLQFRANNAGDCSTSTVVGNFSGAPTATATGTQTLMAAQIGINCAVVFSASPTSTQTHAIFEVAVPLLVTGACSPTPCSPSTDPAYFYFLQTTKPGPRNLGTYTAFEFDDLGTGPFTPPSILGPLGAYIGLAPTAGPLGPPPATGSSATFALCASLPQNGNGQALVPAVGAYYAIATDGETLLSAPLPSASTSTCPPL
jgi:hypothetical protein